MSLHKTHICVVKSLVKIAAVSWHSLRRFIKPAPGLQIYHCSIRLLRDSTSELAICTYYRRLIIISLLQCMPTFIPDANDLIHNMIMKATPKKRPGAGFTNRRRLCQLTAAILTSDLTTHM